MRKNDEVIASYKERKSLYSQLGNNVSEAIETFLKENGIDFLSVTSRIKELESLENKLNRKEYNILDDVEDICGIRIICFYQSDIQKICDLIKKEFEIQENQDKEELLNEDQFGYRSHHFIAKVNNKWCQAPNYRGLTGLKFEIQIRTILMHAWAEIEHKLAYKSENQIPRHFRRKLSLISGMLEVTDGQFEDIRLQSLEYRKTLSKKGKKEGLEYYEGIELNLDSLQSFLDSKFPYRTRSLDETRALLNELDTYKITISDIISALNIVTPYLEELETYTFGKPIENHYKGWAQVGIIRSALDITNPQYLNGRFTTTQHPLKNKIIEIRKKINMAKTLPQKNKSK